MNQTPAGSVQFPESGFTDALEYPMMPRRLLVILFGAVIALVTACGGGSNPAQSHPASRAPSSSSAQAKSGGSNSIPQGGGGDHDGDNSGGPSDGDGNV